MSVGGPLQAVNIRGRSFNVDAEASVGMKLGGFENEQKPNGNGSSRQIKKRNSWMLSDVVIEIDHDRGDAEYLQESSDMKGNYDISATLVSEDVFDGVGSIVGEISIDTTETTTSISLSGPGKLTKQGN